jgi:hypothetical protein
MRAPIQILEDLRHVPVAELAVIIEHALEEHGGKLDAWHDASSDAEREAAELAVFGAPIPN